MNRLSATVIAPKAIPAAAHARPGRRPVRTKTKITIASSTRSAAGYARLTITVSALPVVLFRTTWSTIDALTAVAAKAAIAPSSQTLRSKREIRERMSSASAA